MERSLVLMIIDDLEIYSRRSNASVECIHMFTEKPLGITCNFNEWGFRGPDYSDYVGLPVNICLGDSFTVNHGAPVEHSWPSLLEEKLGTATLNFGLDGAGNDTIKLIHERLNYYFDVQNVFVMYSFFHRRLIDGVLTQIVDSLDVNVKHFEQHFIPDAYYTFIPEWSWDDNEAGYIRAEHSQCLPTDYTNWQPGHVKKKQRIHITDKSLFNKDGMHMSLARNQLVAEYFYQKVNDNG
jgi:hypothetical protein